VPSRRKLHTRTIRLEGFERDDGLYDVEAELTDVKTYSFATSDRQIEDGMALHHMKARLAVNEDMLIVEAEAETLAGPFNICGGGAETFAHLVGLTVKPGFLRAANERLAGTLGCTHLREMLQQMATVAFQTLYPARARREGPSPEGPPRLLNSCHAYDSAGPVIQERFPKYYTGV
jgi:hypothetical protein